MLKNPFLSKKNKNNNDIVIVDVRSEYDDIIIIVNTKGNLAIDFEYRLSENDWLKSVDILWNLRLFKYLIGEEAYSYLKSKSVVLKYMSEITQSHFKDENDKDKPITLSSLLVFKEKVDQHSRSTKLWSMFSLSNSLYTKSYWVQKLKDYA